MIQRLLNIPETLLEALGAGLKNLLLPSPATPEPSNVRKILVVGYGGLGDVLFLLPALQALRKHYSQAVITCLTGSYSAGPRLLQNMTRGLVDHIEFCEWTKPEVKKQKKEINQKIIDGRYDLLIVPYTGAVRFFLKGFSSIPIRVGHCRRIPASSWSYKLFLEIWEEELFRKLLFNRKVWIAQDKEHEIDKALRLAYAAGVPQGAPRQPLIFIDDQDVKIVEKALADKGARPEDKLIAFQLGISAAMGWKQWGAERFAQLANKLSQELQAKIVLIGSIEEEKLVLNFLKECPEAISFVEIPGLNLSQTAAVLQHCQLLIANDSGPAKLAMALGTPTAIVWGTTDRFGAGPWTPGHITISNTQEDPHFALGIMKEGKTTEDCQKGLRDLPVEKAFNNILGTILSHK